MSNLKQSQFSRRDFLRLAGAAGGVAMLGAYAPHAFAAPGMSRLAANKYDGVTLRVLNQGGGAWEDAVKQFAVEFKEQTGCQVEFDSTPWEGLQAKLQADLASGQPKYDIFASDIEFQYTIYPSLLPLNDLIKKYNYDMDGFFQPVYKYGEGIAGGLAGQRFGLPIRVGASWVFYRTDLIKEFPTTWADYEKMLKENTGGGKYGLAHAGVTAQLIKIFLARYWSQGDPLITPDWKPLINSDKGVKAAEMMLNQIKNYCPPGMLGWDNPDADAAFLNGDVAIMEGWAQSILRDIQNPEKSKVVDKWSVASYPEKGTGNFTQHNMDILNTTKNPDAAFEYVAYCTGMSNAKRLLMEFNEEAPRKTVWMEPDVLKVKPYLEGVAAAYENGKPFLPGVPQWLEMFIGLGEGLALAMAEKQTPKDALDGAAKKWTDLLEQAPLSFPYKE